MKNELLKSFIVIAIAIAASASCACLADTESSTESQSESPGPVLTSPGSVSPAPSVNQAIQSSNLSPAAKHVDVTNNDGAVVIRGTVPTNGDKQKINSMAERTGAQNIRNELKVENSGTTKTKAASKARIITPKYSH